MNGQHVVQKEKGAREGSVPATTGPYPTEGPKAFPGESSEDWNGAHCPGKSPDTGIAGEECHGLTSFVISSNDCILEYCALEKIHHLGVIGGPSHRMQCAVLTPHPTPPRSWMGTNTLPTLVILNLWSVVCRPLALFQWRSYLYSVNFYTACLLYYLPT